VLSVTVMDAISQGASTRGSDLQNPGERAKAAAEAHEVRIAVALRAFRAMVGR